MVFWCFQWHDKNGLNTLQITMQFLQSNQDLQPVPCSSNIFCQSHTTFPLLLPIWKVIFITSADHAHFYSLCQSDTTFSLLLPMTNDIFIISANDTRQFHYFYQWHTTFSLFLPMTHDIFIISGNLTRANHTTFPLLLPIWHHISVTSVNDTGHFHYFCQNTQHFHNFWVNNRRETSPEISENAYLI